MSVFYTETFDVYRATDTLDANTREINQSFVSNSTNNPGFIYTKESFQFTDDVGRLVGIRRLICDISVDVQEDDEVLHDGNKYAVTKVYNVFGHHLEVTLERKAYQ